MMGRRKASQSIPKRLGSTKLVLDLLPSRLVSSRLVSYHLTDQLRVHATRFGHGREQAEPSSGVCLWLV
jgi:hypothetical protein